MITWPRAVPLKKPKAPWNDVTLGEEMVVAGLLLHSGGSVGLFCTAADFHYRGSATPWPSR